MQKGSNTKFVLASENLYKSAIGFIQNSPLNQFLLNYKKMIKNVYNVIEKDDEEFYVESFHRHLLPQYLQTIKNKLDSLNDVLENCEATPVVHQIKKLFEKYCQKFNIEFPKINSTEIFEYCEERYLQHIEKISLQNFSNFNPKHICCFRFVYEGKFNCQNLEHEFTVIRMPNQNQIKRSLLENAICSGLNYKKDVVLVIGVNLDMEVVGIIYNQKLQNKLKLLINKILQQSIKPQINFQDQIFKIKFIPVLERKNLKETGKCMITISIHLKKSNFHYISIEKKGYSSTFLQYGFQKNHKSLNNLTKNQTIKAPLEVIQLKGEQLYKNMLQTFSNKRKKRIHYDSCTPAREFIQVSREQSEDSFSQRVKFDEDKITEVLKGYQEYPYFTILKFHQENESAEKYIIDQVDGELEYQRESFLIKRIQYAERKVQPGFSPIETALYLHIIMHEHPPQMIKNTLGKFHNSNNFEYGSVKPLSKINDLKDNNEINELKRLDHSFMSIYQKSFPPESISRFYTINSKNIRKIYYKINNNIPQVNHLIASSLIYIINMKLGLNPQFAETSSINTPKYELAFRK